MIPTCTGIRITAPRNPSAVAEVATSENRESRSKISDMAVSISGFPSATMTVTGPSFCRVPGPVMSPLPYLSRQGFLAAAL